jgi:hypothetical protein
MLDLPTRSVLVGGLERWEMRQGAFKPIEEPRLAKMIERMLLATGRLEESRSLSLRTPPLAADVFNREPPGVAVTVFPTWFVCAADRTKIGAEDVRRRRLVRWSDLDPAGGRRRCVLDDGKKVEVTPIRFVAGCEMGHLQDIDWRWVVHGEREARCREPMWLAETGTSADPRDTRVECNCGRSLSLEEAFQRGRLGHCRGERPWLGERDPDGCDKWLRFLTRTATNTYFPQVATVISLPSAEDALSALVQGHFTDLADAQSPADIAQARRFNSALRASLEGYANSEVFARLQVLRNRRDQDASLAPKLAEFDVFAGGSAIIGENRPESLLFAETLRRGLWDPHGDPLVASTASLVVVHRLREVSCLYGFTRFEAAPTAADGELEDVQLAVRGAPLSLGADWLPAVEAFGEGLFVHFDGAAVGAWTDRAPVKARAKQLLAGFDLWERQHQTQLDYPGAAYTMLHGLSHALMTEIALECGYPASALKERIYALSDPAGTSRYGVLVYTATAGNQGTLGGLVATAPNFARILRAALQRLAVCSNDPICSDHEPASTVDDRALHGAACHGCLLIAETSCEARNLFLDRGLLVETMAWRNAGFFRERHYQSAAF